MSTGRSTGPPAAQRRMPQSMSGLAVRVPGGGGRRRPPPRPEPGPQTPAARDAARVTWTTVARRMKVGQGLSAGLPGVAAELEGQQQQDRVGAGRSCRPACGRCEGSLSASSSETAGDGFISGVGAAPSAAATG